VGGITYHAGTRGPAGRQLRDRDLGAQVSVVRCKLADQAAANPAAPRQRPHGG